MKTRKQERRLAKLILAALMATGGGLWSSSAEATEYTWNGVLSVAEIAHVGAIDYLNPTYGYNTLNFTTPGSSNYAAAGYVNAPTTPLQSFTVNVNGGFWAGVYGAFADSSSTGIVSRNTVTVNNGGIIQKVICGGVSKGSGNVEKNIVNIKGGEVGYKSDHTEESGAEIRGGYIEGGSGNAIGNEVNIESGKVNAAFVYGAYTNSTGNVESNKVTISGVTVNGKVYGGRSAQGSATGNEVTIGTGAIVGEVRGGTTDGAGTGSADKNTVTINGGTVKDEVYGGLSFGGSATGNKIIVNNTDATVSSAVMAGDGKTGATDNHVTIKAGKFTGEMRGGYSTNGEANDNTVTISGGEVTNYIFGGQGKNGASKNTVTISDAGSLGNGTARVYGGSTMNGAADNNIVNIFVPVNVLHIMGGESINGTASGNTLNIAAKGVTVGNEGVAGFQNLNFFLPTDMTTSDKMLTVNGTAYVTDAKVGVMAQGKLANLTKNDKVTLLHAETMNGTVSQTTEIDVPASIATVDTYEFNVTSDTNNIYATITKEPEEEPGGGGDSKADMARENTKSVVETKAATTTFINAGADMLASQGFSEAANAVAIEMAENAKNGTGAQPVGGFTPFAAFGGSSLRAESGSHVDTKGFGLNVGFARELPNSQGKLLFGPIVEYGGGSYDSYLDNGVHGDGGSHYFGIGIMARQVNHDGFYYEGSLRGGRVKSDYKGAFNLQNVDYDSSSNYWAAHLGLGKAFAVGKNNTLDGYVKYFYSHQGGDSVTLHGSVTGDEDWSFDSVDSNRIRIGARLTHKVNERNSFYGGLAYQYEFSGDATAHYNGGSTPSPSVKGSSGLLELGWQVKPGEGPLTLDLGVNGWAGKQRGGSVQLGATWTF